MAVLASRDSHPTPHSVELYPEYFCYLGVALCNCGNVNRANERLQQYYDSQDTSKAEQKRCPQPPYYRKAKFWTIVGSAAGAAVLSVGVYFGVQYALLRVPAR